MSARDLCHRSLQLPPAARGLPRQDYIGESRAKGLPEWLVLTRHLVRNASLPMVTLGLNLLFYESLVKVDYPVMLAYTLAGAVLVVAGNLIADIALTVAGPRIRLA